MPTREIKSRSIPRTEIKSISTTTQNQVNLDAHTITKWFSARTQKTKSVPISHTEIKSISKTHTTKSISSVHWNKVKFDLPHWNQVNFAHLHKNQVNFDVHTKPKRCLANIEKPIQFQPPTQKPSQSIPTLKTIGSRPAHKDQVNFDHTHKNKLHRSPN